MPALGQYAELRPRSGIRTRIARAMAQTLNPRITPYAEVDIRLILTRQQFQSRSLSGIARR